MQGNSPKNCCELSIRAFDKSSLPAHRHRECRRTSAARRFPKEVEYGRVPREKHTPLKVSSAQSCRSAHLASFRIKGLAAETSARNAVLRSLSRVAHSNRRKWSAHLAGRVRRVEHPTRPAALGCLGRPRRGKRRGYCSLFLRGRSLRSNGWAALRGLLPSSCSVACASCTPRPSSVSNRSSPFVSPVNSNRESERVLARRRPVGQRRLEMLALCSE